MDYGLSKIFQNSFSPDLLKRQEEAILNGQQPPIPTGTHIELAVDPENPGNRTYIDNIDSVKPGNVTSIGKYSVLKPDVELGSGVRVRQGVTINERAKIDHGAEIGHDSKIGADVVIGYLALIGSQVTIDAGTQLGDDTEVGDDVHIGSGTRIGSFSHVGDRTVVGNDSILEDHVQVSADSHIGRNAQIGANSRILKSRLKEKVTVGDSAIIRDSIVGPNATVGNTAEVWDSHVDGANDRIIKKRRPKVGRPNDSRLLSSIGEGAVVSGARVSMSAQIGKGALVTHDIEQHDFVPDEHVTKRRSSKRITKHSDIKPVRSAARPKNGIQFALSKIGLGSARQRKITQR
ncbi:hypothetical protein KC963_01370 [Candidatus Saccharibacteria bacterium]|nr:hypothetical protein [Candidatus Saccharibacteria bacterium]